MNNSIIKVLTAGKRLGADGPRELVSTLVSRPCLDGDEFDLRSYIRNLEEILNDPEASDEDYDWVINRITFLDGTIEWVEDWDGRDIAFVSFSSSSEAAA